MQSAVCPNCRAKLPTEDVTFGWCAECGKKLPDHGIVTSPRTTAPPDYDRPEAPAAEAGPSPVVRLAVAFAARFFAFLFGLVGLAGLIALMGRDTPALMYRDSLLWQFGVKAGLWLHAVACLATARLWWGRSRLGVFAAAGIFLYSACLSAGDFLFLFDWHWWSAAVVYLTLVLAGWAALVSPLLWRGLRTT